MNLIKVFFFLHSKLKGHRQITDGSKHLNKQILWNSSNLAKYFKMIASLIKD